MKEFWRYLTGAGLLDAKRLGPTARRVTVGADKGYDTGEFVTTCRSFQVTPHVAMKQRHSALDRRTSRHAGYAASQRVRKRVEEVFGWLKTVGGGRTSPGSGLCYVIILINVTPSLAEIAFSH